MDTNICELYRYGDAADGQLLAAAGKLTDAQLDREFDIGRGTLRRTLMHIWAGHDVWLSRWMGKVETPWPDEDEQLPIQKLKGRYHHTVLERTTFLASLTADDAGRAMTYRDSKGGLFGATLGQMILQGVVHAVHHRAQAVNLVRRLEAGLVELDYMVSVRKSCEI